MAAPTVVVNRNVVVVAVVAALAMVAIGFAIGRANDDDSTGTLNPATARSSEERGDEGSSSADRTTLSAPGSSAPTTASPEGSAGGAAALPATACAEDCIGTDVPQASVADVIRLTAGGSRYTDTQGNTWEPASCEGGNAYVSPNPIDGTDDDVLFQARKFEPRCVIEVPTGEYAVTLGWAETYRADPGYRVFDVVIEGRMVESIDVGKAAGLNRTYLRTFPATVTDDELEIEAREDENRPMLAVILVERIGDVAPGTSGADDSPETPREPREPGVLTVGPGQQFESLQDAVDEAGPGDTIELSTPGDHAGPVISSRDGSADAPITVTAVDGARLVCPSPDEGEVARCFELNHSYYVFDHFSIEGGSSNLYIVGPSAGEYVHDVKVLNSTFRGAPDGGTGECIRVKYQAYAIEIAHNDIADCGLGKCCDDSKNGEAVYIGTAPEQLEEKNPSPETDETHDVWVHDNVMRPLNECVDIKEGAHSNIVEHNTCSGQQDDDSGGVGSRGGLVGKGNVFRFNVIENTIGACVRFGGDDEPDGTGNDFYGNVCRDIRGQYGVNQQVEPQGMVCGNRFEGVSPATDSDKNTKLSRTESVDPAAACPGGVDMSGAAQPGAR